MVDVPETKYAHCGDVDIAYQIWGDGPVTLVGVPPVVCAIEVAWEEPHYAGFLRRFGSFTRIVHFDKRGFGASDRTVGAPTLEERVDDLRAIMDAEGIERAVLGGISEGGSMAMLFAALYPERVTHLLLYGTTATFRGGDDYAYMPIPEVSEQFVDAWAAAWGTPQTLTAPVFVPSMAGDEHFLRWLNRFERASTSPGGLRAMMRLNNAIDIRPILPTIRVPTIVIHRSGDRAVPVENGRWLSEHIEGATYVEIPGDDHIPWHGDQDSFFEPLEEFLGAAPAHDFERVLSTVVFTDIVDSTARAAEIGDRRWRDLLDRHDVVAQSEVERFGGRIVKTTGDGLLATFDGPARGIRCAHALTRHLVADGLPIRAGVHTGEIELREADIGGIGVHIGARVSAKAEAGEVLVSRTVKDLVAGSGISFEDRGTHELKGVPDQWQLYAVTSA